MPQKNNMKLLNLGCGSHFHKDWVNIDFASQDASVISYDLLEGIPFSDNTFDVVYHSHLLEHFPHNEAVKFTNECYRVLKPRGIIRIATPDLEQIVKNYLLSLSETLKGNKKAEANYDWMMLEMYDQFGRNNQGGEMGKLYKNSNIINPDFIYKRVGIKINIQPPININLALAVNHPLVFLKNILKNFVRIAELIKSMPHSRELILRLFLGKEFKYYAVGKFRFSGEAHQWMYDRFSLARLLRRTGFKKIRIYGAHESSIPKWNSYNLDTNPNGTVYKPDSFYMEAVK